MVGLLTAPASQLVSSAGWADTLKVGGVFSPSGHALGPAHKAYLPYCSSDSWVGDASWTDEGGTWQMRGAANLRVAVESLLDGGMDSAALVLVGGCSAGGRGAMYNLDAVCAQVASRNPVALCAGLHDAPWWLDTPPSLRPSQPPLFDVARKGLALWRGGEGYDPAALPAPLGECAAARVRQGGDAAECIFAQTLLAAVKAPVFLQTNQYDAFQLFYDFGLPWSLTVAMATYESNATVRQAVDAARGSFQSELSAAFGGDRRSAVSLPRLLMLSGGSDAPLRHAFSSACYGHCMIENDAFFSAATVSGVGLSETVGRYIDALTGTLERLDRLGRLGSRRGGSRVLVLDDCEGFSCSVGCPAIEEQEGRHDANPSSGPDQRPATSARTTHAPANGERANAFHFKN